MAIQCTCKIWDHKLSSITVDIYWTEALLCKSGVVGKIIISLHFVVMAIQYTSKTGTTNCRLLYRGLGTSIDNKTSCNKFLQSLNYSEILSEIRLLRNFTISELLC